MSREFVVVWAGRHRRDDWDQLCDRYRKRISHFVKLTETPVRVRGSAKGENRLVSEAEALLAAAPPNAWTVALDSRGKQRTSAELAVWQQRLVEDWPHPIVFLLGSDLGLDSSMREQSREQFSLGPMTLPHELARLVLYEQIYRGFCITAGIKYHRDPL